MPLEFPAFRAALERQRATEVQRRKRHRPVDPRRTDLARCNHMLDRKKCSKIDCVGHTRFKNNMCCRKRNCASKYTSRDVLVLRSSLIARPRNSVDRRAFLSQRYAPRRHRQTRGSGVYICDSPSYCRLATVASLDQSLPLQPLDTIEVCASFFHWAYCVSNDSTRKSLSTRLEYSKRTKVADSPKQWKVEAWLEDISQYYQLQPDSNLILLPFANRTSVYELYTIDEASTVSSSYFLKVCMHSFLSPWFEVFCICTLFSSEVFLDMKYTLHSIVFRF